MNRYKIERYSIIAQIIDDVENDLGIDLYLYDEVITEKTSDNQYVVKADYENIRISIKFYVEDNANYAHDTVVFVDVLTDDTELHLDYDIEYNHAENNHVLAIEREQ